jgi:hypothetical protein
MQETATRLSNTLDVLQDVRTALQRLDLPQPLYLFPQDTSRHAAWKQLFVAAGFRLDDLSSRSIQNGRRPSVVPEGGNRNRLRREALGAAGIDIDDVARRLAAGERVGLSIPTFEAPLPMGWNTWQQHIPRSVQTPERMLQWLLRDSSGRGAALYVGSTGLDPLTAVLFAGNAELIEAAKTNYKAFAAFSATLRLRNGGIVTPGGPEMEPLWADFANGTPPTEPAAFVLQMLTRDDGRGLWFYGSIVWASPSTQRYVLGAWLPEKERRNAFRDAYDRFKRYLPEPGFLARAFLLPDFDPAMAWSVLQTAADGMPLPPNSRRFLEQAIAKHGDAPPDRSHTADRPDDLLTAASLLDLLYEPLRQNALPRLQALAYGQRRLLARPDVPPGMLTAAMRGRLKYPALLATIERAAPRAAAAAAYAAAEAARIQAFDPRKAHTSLVQFQALIALVQMMTDSGGLPPDRADALLSELAGRRLTPYGDGSYGGRAVVWIDHILRKELVQLVGRQSDSVDELVWLVLAGRTKARQAVQLAWRGNSYQFDPTEAALDRLRRVRVRLRAPTLDHLIAFTVNAERLDSLTSEADARHTVQELARTGGILLKQTPAEFGGARVAPEHDNVQEWFVRIVKDLERHVADGRLDRLGRSAQDLLGLSDWIAAHALMSLVYAAAVHNADDHILDRDDILQTHDFGTALPRHLHEQVSWDLARANAGVRHQRNCGSDSRLVRCEVTPLLDPTIEWHIEGSLLGLEMALLPDAMRTARSVSAATLAELDVEEVRRSAAIRFPKLTDDSRRVVVAFIQRGRERLHEPAFDVTALPSWRFAAVPWATVHEPDRVGDLATLQELLRLGLSDLASDLSALDGWGGSAASLSGCLCRQLLPHVVIDMFSMRPNAGYLAIFSAELHLRLAELTMTDRYPVELTDALYNEAIAELNLSEQAGHNADWEPVLRTFRRIASSDVDRYLSRLNAARVLISIEGIQR